jgi:hypothetical protein
VDPLLARLRRVVRPGWPAPVEPLGEPLQRALDALVGLACDGPARADGVSHTAEREDEEGHDYVARVRAELQSERWLRWPDGSGGVAYLTGLGRGAARPGRDRPSQ